MNDDLNESNIDNEFIELFSDKNYNWQIYFFILIIFLYISNLYILFAHSFPTNIISITIISLLLFILISVTKRFYIKRDSLIRIFKNTDIINLDLKNDYLKESIKKSFPKVDSSIKQVYIKYMMSRFKYCDRIFYFLFLASIPLLLLLPQVFIYQFYPSLSFSIIEILFFFFISLIFTIYLFFLGFSLEHIALQLEVGKAITYLEHLEMC